MLKEVQKFLKEYRNRIIMKIDLFYNYGEIDEIGLGHKYRCQEIRNELEARGHLVRFVSGCEEDSDVLIIDHMFSQKNIIENAKKAGKFVVLIDGDKNDVPLVDLSISAFCNMYSAFRGFKYIVFPKNNGVIKNDYGWKIFIGVGGFDKNNYAEMLIQILEKFKFELVVAKSINHGDFDKYKNVTHFSGNFYEAMKDCRIAITNGGLTMFQALHFGLPCIAIPQYDHQKINIGAVSIFCFEAIPERDCIIENVYQLISSRILRESLSNISKRCIGGDGCKNVCDLVEKYANK